MDGLRKNVRETLGREAQDNLLGGYITVRNRHTDDVIEVRCKVGSDVLNECFSTTGVAFDSVLGVAFNLALLIIQPKEEPTTIVLLDIIGINHDVSLLTPVGLISYLERLMIDCSVDDACQML